MKAKSNWQTFHVSCKTCFSTPSQVLAIAPAKNSLSAKHRAFAVVWWTKKKHVRQTTQLHGVFRSRNTAPKLQFFKFGLHLAVNADDVPLLRVDASCTLALFELWCALKSRGHVFHQLVMGVSVRCCCHEHPLSSK